MKECKGPEYISDPDTLRLTHLPNEMN